MKTRKSTSFHGERKNKYHDNKPDHQKKNVASLISYKKTPALTLQNQGYEKINRDKLRI
jgi:hypothetical protein